MNSSARPRHLHLFGRRRNEQTSAQRLPENVLGGVEHGVRKQIMATICVINYDLSLGTMLADLLADRGMDRVVSCSGNDAYHRLAQGDIDLVIVDLMTKMPESGWDVLTYMQMHPQLRRLPAIVCSAVTDELLSKEAWLHQHNISILEKPFELDEFYQCVDTALGRATPASA